MVLSSKNVFVQKGFINGFCEKLVYKKKKIDWKWF